MNDIVVIKKLISNKSIYRFALLLSVILATVIVGCKSKERYVKELERKGIPYSIESFINRAGVGNKEIIELFIKTGIDVNARGNKGETPLMLSAVNHNTEVLKLLIKNGAYVNAKNNDGYTALMFVSSQGDLEVAKLLIEKGADVNAKSNKGDTALTYAFLNTQLEETLRKAGQKNKYPFLLNPGFCEYLKDSEVKKPL